MAQSKFIRGNETLIKYNKGTAEAPDYVVIGGQQSCTLNRSADTIETTYKSGNRFKEFDTSYIEWSIDFDGMIINNDESFEILEQSLLEGKILEIQMAMPNGRTYAGNVICVDLPIEAGYDSNATYSSSFQGTGELKMTKTVVETDGE